MEAQLLQPMLGLVIWSFVMWGWMYATRIPAIAKMKMRLDPCAPNGEQMSKLPPNVRWKADNYNHLLEQPILFYVVVFALITLNDFREVNLYCAWAYVFLRVIHSLVQALINRIELRFALFVLSNIPLAILTCNASVIAFSAN